jgi:hypothetical protein
MTTLKKKIKIATNSLPRPRRRTRPVHLLPFHQLFLPPTPPNQVRRLPAFATVHPATASSCLASPQLSHETDLSVVPETEISARPSSPDSTVPEAETTASLLLLPRLPVFSSLNWPPHVTSSSSSSFSSIYPR